jgi:hypothetical protein
MINFRLNSFVVFYPYDFHSIYNLLLDNPGTHNLNKDRYRIDYNLNL